MASLKTADCYINQGRKNSIARRPGGARIGLRAPLKKYGGAREEPGSKRKFWAFQCFKLELDIFIRSRAAAV